MISSKLIDRREFIGLTVSSATLLVAGCAGEHVSLVGPRPIGPNHGSKIDVGAISDYPIDGATDQFAKSDGVIVVRAGDRIYATSALCTHQACPLKLVGQQLRCPCHGSRFDLRGNVIKGPATE